MKKKDRKRSQRKKNWEGTTSELSRTYGQIVDRGLSRRTTEGEKRNVNRENKSSRRLEPRSGRPRTAICKTKETNTHHAGAICKVLLLCPKKSYCCARIASLLVVVAAARSCPSLVRAREFQFFQLNSKFFS